jgi:hypothetical protein
VDLLLKKGNPVKIMNEYSKMATTTANVSNGTMLQYFGQFSLN